MKIDFDKNRDYILVENVNGEQIDFDIMVYKQAKINQVIDVLSPINRYMETMTNAQLAELFSLYLAAKDILLSVEVVEYTDKRLTEVVRQILDVVDLERLGRWVIYKSGINIPTDVKSDFSEVDEVFERDRTYLRNEYIDLLIVAVALRFILPIWGEYMFVFRDIVSDYTRELRAYSLLKSSVISEHPAYDRLMIYIERSFDLSTKTISGTVAGIGREEIPEWFCALLLVRRLPIIDLTTTTRAPNIIHNLHGYVKDSMENLDKKFKETINTKKKPSKQARAEEKDPSFLETYRVKQEIPYGQIDMYNVYMADVLRVCQTVDPTIPPELVQQVLDVTQGLEQLEVNEHNVRIAQWTLVDVIPPALMEVIEKIAVTKAMIASQALLHHWGLHDLALIVTGINLPEQINVLGDPLARLPDSYLDKIDVIYPYTIQPAKGKQRPVNKVTDEILSLAQDLILYKKSIRAPAFLTPEQVPYVNRWGHLTTPAHVTLSLAELLFRTQTLGD